MPTQLVAGNRWQESVHKSVAKVTVYSPENKPLYSGSVFAISPRQLVTANHVCAGVKPGGTIGIRESNRVIGFKIKKINRGADLCLLEGPHKLKPLKLANRQPKIGEKASVFGYPLGVGAFLTEGSYGYEAEIYGDLRQFLSIQSCGGNSGSPVLNKYGRVTGVLIEGISSPFPLRS